MVTVDLNADVGEECGDDLALLGIVTSANVAAGGHAGGGVVLDDTVALAVQWGVAVGAHPSYPDREAFGRRSRLADHGPAGIRSFVCEQVLEVAEAAHRHGVHLSHVKAHGALYADAGEDPAAAEAVVAGVLAAAVSGGGLPLAVLGMPGTAMERACGLAGLSFVPEAFADRAYTPSGRLVSRSHPGSVITDPEAVAARSVRMVIDGVVTAEDGSDILVRAQTVCVHGDTPGAVALARRVRSDLEERGVRVARLDSRP